jgi:phage shock protein C
MKDKKLTRSTDDRMLAGVAGGLADYLDIDPVIVRLLFVIITLFGGGFVGILLYVVLWIIMPEPSSV